jgi:hypothetical protein
MTVRLGDGHAEDIDAAFGRRAGERKRRLPSVVGVLQFQHVVLAQRVRQLQRDYRERRCRNHYEQALRQVAREIGLAIPRCKLALHK